MKKGKLKLLSNDIFQKRLSMASKIELHPALNIELRLRELETSFNIFIGNSIELKKNLCIFDSYELSNEWYKQKDDLWEEFVKDLNRLFHNYLASSVSFIEYLEYFKTIFEPKSDIEHEVSTRQKITFTESPFCCFVRKLRVYIIHHWLPKISAVEKWYHEPKGYEKFISLIEIHEVESYIKLQMQNKKGKRPDSYAVKALEYIDSIREEPEKLKISTIVEEYSRIVINFYIWIDQKTKKHFCKELSELSTLWKELSSLQEQQMWVDISKNKT
jgi:hypothetical protein